MHNGGEHALALLVREGLSVDHACRKLLPHGRRNRFGRAAANAAHVVEEVAQLAASVRRADGFGMVLYRLYVERLVAKAHYLAVLARGAHLEAVGQRGALDGERVVAHRLEALREAAEDALAVVGDAARLAVH